MSSSVTGNPAGVVSPMGAAPTAGVVPVITVPSDGDAASAASVSPANNQLVNHMALLMLIIGGTRTAKAVAVDATGGTTVTTTPGCVTASGDITATGRVVGGGITPTANAGTSPVAATMYKDLVPWAWAQVAWTGSAYSIQSSAGFDLTYSTGGINKLATGIVQMQLINAAPSGNPGLCVQITPISSIPAFFCGGGSASPQNPKVFILNASSVATDNGFFITVFAK